MDQVRGCTDRDKLVVRALKELGSGTDLWGNEWEEWDGLVLFRGRVYIPLDAQLRHDIVEAHHDTPVTGHSGRWKTTAGSTELLVAGDETLHCEVCEGLRPL